MAGLLRWQGPEAGDEARSGLQQPEADRREDHQPARERPAPTPANPNPAPVVQNVIQQVAPATPAAGKKAVSAKAKKAYRKCVRKAKAKHSKKAVRRAKKRCARMPH